MQLYNNIIVFICTIILSYTCMYHNIFIKHEIKNLTGMASRKALLAWLAVKPC